MNTLFQIFKNISHSLAFILASFISYLAYQATDYDFLWSLSRLQFISGYVILIINLGIKDSLK